MNMKIRPKLSVFLLLILAWTFKSCGINQGSTSSQDPWDQVDEILSKIIAPEFPDRDFLITDYGAVADGTTKNTVAIRRAIEACNAAGGGRVVVPEGEFMTGPIYLKSNVNLHVQKGAKI
jgi:polygalacturonase